MTAGAVASINFVNFGDQPGCFRRLRSHVMTAA